MSPLAAVLSLAVAGHAHCTAFLVAPNAALTAAHCVVGEPAARMTVTPPGGATPIAISQTYCLGRYRTGRWWDDVALVTLASPAAPPPLRVCADDCFDGGERGYAFAGYGRRHGDPPAPPLRRDAARIRRKDRGLVWLAPSGVLPCYGDSGAPLLGPGGRAVALEVGGDEACHKSAWFARLDAPALRPLLRAAAMSRPPGPEVAFPC